MSYIELHSRSAFSFLEGASHPETLVDRALALELPAMALLDRDGFYGAARFHLWGKKHGLRTHIGAEVTCEDRVAQPPSAVRPGEARLNDTFRLPLLCASRAGYQNLCRLITRAKARAEKDKSVAREEELQESASGLICLTGDERGPLATALRRGAARGPAAATEEGRRALERLLRIYGRGNVYVELQRHFDRIQEARNQAAVELAREFRLPLLATGGVCYAAPEDREVLDVFTCIRHRRTLASAGRLLTRNAERYLRSGAEMERLFADLPDAIANTAELSSRLEFTLTDLGYEFPRYPVPAGETMASFLRARTGEGVRERYGRKSEDLRQRARRQIERELELICRLGLEGYFLIVWDLVRFCRESGILAQGRGSAANSAVCYALGITAVDPVGMDLLFERFLSDERGEWPDIDLDLPSGDDRERVIQYVYQRYGKHGAAMTANVITYGGRSAVREVGKVLGLDAESLARLARLANAWEWRDPKDTLGRRFDDAGFDRNHTRIARFFSVLEKVRDLPRHLGQHSGGMIICQGQLDSVVPLEPASMPGRVVVQWDKDDCADLGLVKVDLLGLGMMAVLKDCLHLVPEHYGEPLDLAQLPQDDAETFAAIQRADTIGMFQIESRAQMASLPHNHPSRFYDLVVQVALIRPGPIVGKMVHPYMKRRNGQEAVTYPHPSLEPVLERTLGVPLFQEQLLRMAMICANFSGGEAEELRRALGTSKRINSRMKEIEAKLRRGLTGNGIDGAVQEAIVQFIASFALYGFPESHAASFALIAYASAYLKCHYLAAFTAALLNNQPMGFYSPATIVKDAQRHGLRVRPVDVTCSEWECGLEGGRQSAVGGQLLNCHPDAEQSEAEGALSAATLAAREHISLRLGLRYVRGMNEKIASAVVRARQQQPFFSVDDLARRVPELRQSDLEMLAEVGALNALAGEDKASAHRRTALWQVARAAQAAGPLLEPLEENEDASPLERMTTEERLVADYHGTGMTTGPHPLAYHRAELRARGILSSAELLRAADGAYVKLAGCVISRQRPGTAQGFVFLSLEDETGIANVIVRPHIYDRFRTAVTRASILLIEGNVQSQERVVHLRAERVRPLLLSEVEVRSRDFR